MRTTLLVFSTLAVLAACAQDESTSPGSQSRSPNARASQDAAPNGQGQQGASAKPAPDFSTMTTVTETVSWDGLNKIYGQAVATCPAGSHVTGGGYDFSGGVATITYNAPLGPNAWRVYIYSHEPGSITSYALCIQ